MWGRRERSGGWWWRGGWLGRGGGGGGGGWWGCGGGGGLAGGWGGVRKGAMQCVVKGLTTPTHQKNLFKDINHLWSCSGLFRSIFIPLFISSPDTQLKKPLNTMWKFHYSRQVVVGGKKNLLSIWDAASLRCEASALATCLCKSRGIFDVHGVFGAANWTERTRLLHVLLASSSIAFTRLKPRCVCFWGYFILLYLGRALLTASARSTFCRWH